MNRLALIYHEDFRTHLATIRDDLKSVEHFVVIGRAERGDLGSILKRELRENYWIGRTRRV